MSHCKINLSLLYQFSAGPLCEIQAADAAFLLHAEDMSDFLNEILDVVLANRVQT